MDFGRLRFFLGEVGTNLTRNTTMQLTAIGTVAVTITLLGSCIFMRESVERLSARMLSRIEISAYLNDTATDADAAIVRQEMTHIRHIVSVRYIPKTEGFREMSQRMAGAIDTSLLTSNPLPNAFRIRVDRPEMAGYVARHVALIHAVAKVSYGQILVERLLRIADVLERIGLTIVTLLTLVAAVIVSNTIRLTVFARRREIAIMQLVGATNTSIRAPFIGEGLIDGVLGAGIALGMLAVAHLQLLPRLAAALPFLPLLHLGVDEHRLALELLAIGAAMGTFASWFAVGRYLRT